MPVAYGLLSKTLRLEPIASMIEHQNRPVREVDDSERSGMRLGAEIPRLTLAYEQLTHKGASRTEAAHRLASQNKNFSPEFFEARVTLDPSRLDFAAIILDEEYVRKLVPRTGEI